VKDVGVRCWLSALLAVAILSGCTKGSSQTDTTTTSAATSASTTPTVSPVPGAAVSAAPEASLGAATPGQTTAVTATTPAAEQAASEAPPPGTTSATSTPAGLPQGPPRPFTSAALIAAYAALPDARLTQGDAVQFALSSAQTNLDCDQVRRDFTDDFAAHRNADRYLQALRRQARRMGLASIALRTQLGRYDFPSKSFQIGTDNGDGYSTFAFNTNDPCYVNQSAMPDGSRAYGGVEVELDNGPVLHRYPLDAARAEALGKRLGEYRFTERLVFYATTIARHSDERLGAVGHVTKLVLEERAANAPDTSPPTILMSSDL
jgi:hypothetical protein